MDVGACGITEIDDIYLTCTICCTVFKQPYEVGTSTVLMKKKEKHREVK